MKRLQYIICLLLLSGSTFAQTKTFTNPLLPSGADPWVISKDGYYYYTNSLGDKLVIWKTKDMTNAKNAERKIVWVPPAGKPWSKELWAPELHYIDHK